MVSAMKTQNKANTVLANRTKEIFVRRVKKERKNECCAYKRAEKSLEKRINEAAKRGYSCINITYGLEPSRYFTGFTAMFRFVLGICAAIGIIGGLGLGFTASIITRNLLWFFLGVPIVFALSMAIGGGIFLKIRRNALLHDNNYKMHFWKIDRDSFTALAKKQEENGYDVSCRRWECSGEPREYNISFISTDEAEKLRKFTDPAMYDAYMRGVPADDILA